MFLIFDPMNRSMLLYFPQMNFKMLIIFMPNYFCVDKIIFNIVEGINFPGTY